MNEQHGLAILGLALAPARNGPTALTVTGSGVGKLSLPDRPYYSVAVSPDCVWVAWVPKKFLPWPVGSEEQPVIRSVATALNGTAAWRVGFCYRAS